MGYRWNSAVVMCVGFLACCVSNADASVVVASHEYNPLVTSSYSVDAGQVYADPVLYDNRVAQTFLAGRAGVVDSVSLAISLTAPVDAPLRVSIMSTQGGEPDVSLAESFVHPVEVPALPGGKPYFNVLVDFSSAALLLNEGQEYALVFDSLTNNANYQIWGSASYLYDEGACYTSQNTNAWTEAVGDLYFRIAADLPPGTDGRRTVRNDFDGDGITDLCCFDPAVATWYIMLATNRFYTRYVGVPGGIPITGDFDANGQADIGCYSPDGGEWAVPGLWTIAVEGQDEIFDLFGYAGTVPLVGDFDGDLAEDYGCYDAAGMNGESSGSWYFMTSSNGFFRERFGYAGTVPVVGDFDGDGIDDYGCYDDTGIPGWAPPGSWYFMTSSNGFFTEYFGYPGTVPVVGDFDGDGIDDYGCYDDRGIPGLASPGSWYFMTSSNRFFTETFGYSGTVPVVGDYDGDGIDDYGCYDDRGIPGLVEPGTWFLMRSRDKFTTRTFGYGGTIPLGPTPPSEADYGNGG